MTSEDNIAVATVSSFLENGMLLTGRVQKPFIKGDKLLGAVLSFDGYSETALLHIHQMSGDKPGERLANFSLGDSLLVRIMIQQEGSGRHQVLATEKGVEHPSLVDTLNRSDPESPQSPHSKDVWPQLLESVKVFIVVVLVLGGQGAVLAYSSALDWSKINDVGMLLHLLTTAWNGFLAGLINGTARSIQVVMAIWAGPTVWKYAAPVIGVTTAAVSQVMSSFAAMFKRTPTVETNGVVLKKEASPTQQINGKFVSCILRN